MKTHPKAFTIFADLSTSAIASYALGYAVEKYPDGVERVCVWIKRHWDEFDLWQQEAIIESCKHHNHHKLVQPLIDWMKANVKPITTETPERKYTEKAQPTERKLCR